MACHVKISHIMCVLSAAGSDGTACIGVSNEFLSFYAIFDSHEKYESYVMNHVGPASQTAK